MMISEVARNYNITKRTLRYYEEIGLLTNIKKNESNYRCYDDESLNRLEQILLLKKLNFNINEIREIFILEDDKVIEKILLDKLTKIQQEIDSLAALKKVIVSIVNIRGNKGIQHVNLYEILKEQIYIHKNIERVFEMSQFVGDIVTLEFGVNILACVNEIMDNIKTLRQDIRSKSGKEIPLIRLKDNVDLKEDEYCNYEIKEGWFQLTMERTILMLTFTSFSC